jgi:hypothetical protein
MRYRKLEPNTGDYSFGRGQGDFFVNVPEAVGQSVYTRLMLWTGQWFADLSQGTPWAAEVLGTGTRWTRDIVIQNVVQTTQGVTDVVAYASSVDPNRRTFTAAITVATIYGAPVTIRAPSLPATIPPLPPPPIAGQLLGLKGGNPPQTGTVMTPADLTQPDWTGQAQINDFQVTRADTGNF